MALLPARLAVKAAVAVAEKAEAKVVAKAAEKAAVARAAVAKVVGKEEEAGKAAVAKAEEAEDALDKGDENTTFEPVNLRTFDL